METLSWFLNVVKVALGLGFVIFIHELGHFLLAKWNGVKVEKFSIGFGPTIFGFRRGETEYVLAAIPLGGFVKMLGEGPDDEANKSADPRAFPNKSVGARMAIISAGVIMNILLGLGCFVYAYGQGMDEIPPRIGTVAAGSPAYEAGLRPDDEIVSIDGVGDLSFTSMTFKVRLSAQGQVLHLEVKRPGKNDLIGMDLLPRREAGADHPTIGVRPSNSLNLGLFAPTIGMENPPEFPTAESSGGPPTEMDTLVAAGLVGETPTPMASNGDYQRLVSRYADRPLIHVFERRTVTDEGPGNVLKRFELTLPPTHFVDFGFRLSMEPISSVQKDSIADKAGFRKGDLIVKVDEVEDFDPMRVPTLTFQKAGKPVTFEVERKATDGTTKRHVITAVPNDTPVWTDRLISQENLEVSGLGFSYPVRPQIQAVRPDSPAARADLKPGDVINAVTFPARKAAENGKAKQGKAPAMFDRQEDFTFDEKSPSWVKAFWALQVHSLEPVSMVVNKDSRPINITAERDPNWYFPERGLLFQDLIRKLPPQNIRSALRRGWDDTVENIVHIYAMFRSLAQRRVGPASMAGPLTIVQVAYRAASFGLADLIHFLGLLSINLAVMNFLPIPPLDGGQMVFLIAEKVRGKPLPDSALLVGIYVGILLVLGLMVFVTYQDVFRLIKNWNGF